MANNDRHNFEVHFDLLEVIEVLSFGVMRQTQELELFYEGLWGESHGSHCRLSSRCSSLIAGWSHQINDTVYHLLTTYWFHPARARRFPDTEINSTRHSPTSNVVLDFCFLFFAEVSLKPSYYLPWACQTPDKLLLACYEASMQELASLSCLKVSLQTESTVPFLQTISGLQFLP